VANEIARVLSQQLPFNQPLVVVDVGCSGGFAQKWTDLDFRSQLVGFDPWIEEVLALQKRGLEKETYFCAFVGSQELTYLEPLQNRAFEMTTARAANLKSRLPSNINDGSGKPSTVLDEFFNPDKRTEHSSNAFENRIHRAGEPPAIPLVGENTRRRDGPSYSTIFITLDEFFAEPAWHDVIPNFLKTDTDGFDYGVLEGASGILSSSNLIGVEVECLFHGDPSNARASTFANIDILLRSLGFTLYRLEPHRFSRAALPSPFVYDLAAQTVEGTVQWADTVYFRDPFLNQDFRDALDASPVLRTKYLVALSAMGFYDVIAQALIEFPDEYFPGVNAEEALDMISAGNPVGAKSYRDLIDIFDYDYQSFYPSRLRQESEVSFGTNQGAGLGRRITSGLVKFLGKNK